MYVVQMLVICYCIYYDIAVGLELFHAILPNILQLAFVLWDSLARPLWDLLTSYMYVLQLQYRLNNLHDTGYVYMFLKVIADTLTLTLIVPAAV